MSYSQPDFYHFNEDSIILVNYIKEKIFSTYDTVIDLGAGCGVCGIELSQRVKIKKLAFLEPQDDFLPHLEKNILSLKDHIEVEVYQQLFSNFKTHQKFDLVVSNPPYFTKNSGKVSPDFRRQMSRTWEIDSLHSFINLGYELMSENGHFIFTQPKGDYTYIKNNFEAKIEIQDIDHLSLIHLQRLNID